MKKEDEDRDEMHKCYRCGAVDVEVHVGFDHPGFHRFYQVSCKECGLLARRANTEEEAVLEWNEW